MTDAEYRKTKARVWKLAKRWQTALGLKWWHIEYDWLRESLGDDGKPDWEVTAKVRVEWMYLKACITVCLPVMMDMSDTEIERTLVHEFMHVLVAEMRHPCDDSDSHEERVVTTLTSAIFWTLQNRELTGGSSNGQSGNRRNPLGDRPADDGA